MDRRSSTSLTSSLARTDLFQIKSEDLPVDQRIDTTYRRARAIARAYSESLPLTAQSRTPSLIVWCVDLTAHDIHTLDCLLRASRSTSYTECSVFSLSDKFWAMNSDNIAAIDIAPMALLTIQYNLAAG